ncbi:MAG: pyridoxamine 5'-phosphate oxidase family protein [Patescibacteria group bacterium]
MPEEALAFLTANRIGVISVEMPNGAPHGATVHFAYQKDPFTFVFLTDRTYRKVEPMLDGKEARTSFVVGTDEAQMKTMQLDGIARLTDSDEHKDVYFERFPEKQAKAGDPDDAFIVFTPTWWRYTDFKASGGKLVVES